MGKVLGLQAESRFSDCYFVVAPLQGIGIHCCTALHWNRNSCTDGAGTLQPADAIIPPSSVLHWTDSGIVPLSFVSSCSWSIHCNLSSLPELVAHTSAFPVQNDEEHSTGNLQVRCCNLLVSIISVAIPTNVARLVSVVTRTRCSEHYYSSTTRTGRVLFIVLHRKCRGVCN